MTDVSIQPALASHGGARLPSVEVDDYNAELKDDEGFLGDRASKGAFRAIIENWRKPLRAARMTIRSATSRREAISKKKLDSLLATAIPRRPASCRARSRISPRNWRW